MRAVMVVALVVAVGLAGCASGGDTTGADTFQIQSGKGAIAGLLVDDRFRPIDLEDDAQTEFQAEGFVLLQETGEEVQTNENGEFTFVDLEPGTYTIRVSASDHEATPQKVNVVEGEFAEASIVARRVLSAGSSIITDEYTVFIACDAYATYDCTMDMSGDTDRSGMHFNYTQYNDTLTYGVFEVLTNQGGIYCFEVRETDVGGASVTADHYGNWCTEQDGTYLHGILQNGANYLQDGEDPWDPTAETDAILFYFGNNDATCWNELTGGTAKRCAGVGFGIKAQILVTLFLGEPEVDLESYCLLC